MKRKEDPDTQEGEAGQRDDPAAGKDTRASGLSAGAGDPALAANGEEQKESLRQTHAALQEEHRRYVDLYHRSPVAYLTLTCAGTITEINKAGSKLLGGPGCSVLRRPLSDFLVAADAYRWRQFLATVMRRGGSENAEFTLALEGRKGVVVRVDCLRVRHCNRRIAAYVALTDVSDRRRAEASLQKSEARYRNIFDNARSGMAVTDSDALHFIAANAAFLELIACRPEQLNDLGVADIFPADEMPRIAEGFLSFGSGGSATLENTPVRRLDGSIVHVEINGSPFIVSGKKLLLSEFRDVSARKQTEDALRAQEAFFRLITENIGGFIAVLDGGGRTIYSSPSYARLLGDRDSVGADAFADIHPDDRARVGQALRETIASGAGQSLEYRFVLADGGVRRMEGRTGIIGGRERTEIQVVVISNDVTERRASELEVHELAFHDSLTRLPNRLALLDRLRQAIAASKRDAHYGALMFLDLDDFKAVNDSHGHGAGDQLLVQAGERISRCVRETDTAARYGGDEFVVLLGVLSKDGAQSRAQAKGVAQKIRDVFAARFGFDVGSEAGSSVRVEHRCTASIGVVLFFKDESSEDVILQRADRAMYEAKQRGRNHLVFHDEITQTARSARSAQIAQPAPSAAPLPGTAAKSIVAKPQADRPLRIALVEDNARGAAALSLALRQAGHEVVLGASCPELLDRLEQLPPDIVVSDYWLSEGKTGFDAVATLRTSFGREVPALIITGDTDPSVIALMSRAGIPVLHKPFDIGALRTRIADLTAARNGDVS